MVNIVLTPTQLESIASQQQGGPPPVDTGLPDPSEVPPTYVPPPAVADVTYTFESKWQNQAFLSHAKAWHVTFDDLSQGGLWNARIIRASDYVVFGATKFASQQRLRLGNLGAEKARWSGPGYEDITAKLNSLQNVQDTDFMWFPERIRYEVLYDQPWVPGDYILELVDERGQVVNLTFTQPAQMPEAYVTFYTAQAGPARWFYCAYR